MTILPAGPRFRILTLGPSWLEWRGESMPVNRRQARALLYRLGAQLQPVPREELCFTFWPDEPDAVAHRYLSHLISHLRQSLPLIDSVRCRNELVELDSGKVWSDSAAFSAACATPDPALAASIQQALELYRGPFLSGFSLPDCPEFGEWVVQQRSLFERMYLDALWTVINVAAGQGNLNRAIFFARRYLKVDALAEDIHRRLMMFHVMAGDRPAALRQYEKCVAVLRQALGVDPLPETHAIYEAITDNVPIRTGINYE